MNGIEKRIDELGRVVLPAKFRNKLGLNSDARVLISLENNFVIIAPLKNSCIMCGATSDVNENVRLCVDCIKKVKAQP